MPSESRMPSFGQMSMEVLENLFVKELNTEVKDEFMMYQNGLGQIRGMAQLIKGKNVMVKGVREVSGPRFPKSFSAQNGKSKEGFQTRFLGVAIGEHSSYLKRELRPKRVWESEWKARRVKGWCVNCDEKITVETWTQKVVENHIVGAPCGVMDQMTSACGEANKLLAMVCQPAEVIGLVEILGHI